MTCTTHVPELRTDLPNLQVKQLVAQQKRANAFFEKGVTPPLSTSIFTEPLCSAKPARGGSRFQGLAPELRDGCRDGSCHETRRRSF